jgi:hypothetical protein
MAAAMAAAAGLSVKHSSLDDPWSVPLLGPNRFHKSRRNRLSSDQDCGSADMAGPDSPAKIQLRVPFK